MKLLTHSKLQRCNRWNLGMNKSFHPTLYCACDYLSMLVLKLIHVSTRYLNDTCTRITNNLSQKVLLALLFFSYRYTLNWSAESGKNLPYHYYYKHNSFYVSYKFQQVWHDDSELVALTHPQNIYINATTSHRILLLYMFAVRWHLAAQHHVRDDCTQ